MAWTRPSLALQRLRRWREQFPFEDDQIFANRLAAAGLTERDCLAVLGRPSTKACAIFAEVTPEWVTTLCDAFDRAPADRADAQDIEQLTVTDALPLVGPLVQRERARLRAGALEISRRYSTVPFDAESLDGLLLGPLTAHLRWMLNRTLVLELHLARHRGLLRGESSESRYQSFLERLRESDAARAIFRDYPVLARQVLRAATQWTDSMLEFVERLSADWSAIQARFCPQHVPGPLTQLLGGAGDRHRNGRSVLIVTFASGFRLVYKPRSLGIDRHFDELLQWVNAWGWKPAFRTLEVLDRGDYGWQEFVAAVPCHSEPEVTRFYERQGGNLALLYLLNAVDFHHHNLIACGEHPLLVDREGLLHPWIAPGGANHFSSLAATALASSVVRSGLLPQPRFLGSPAIPDISGLGTVEGQLTPFDVPQWEAGGTDEMRYVRRPAPMRGARNRPTLGGAQVELAEQTESIAKGFRRLYELLLAHRQELLSDTGPLARFRADEVRVVLRSTQTYGVLLEESFHPDMLQDAVEREFLFDRLWGVVEQAPEMRRIVPAEQQALQRGDVPHFTTRPDSRDLWTCTGERIPEFLEEPSLPRIFQRLAGFSEGDLELQLWILRASLGARATTRVHTRTSSLAPDRGASSYDLRERSVAAACRIGDRLDQLALRQGDEVGWLGYELTAKDSWSIVPLGIDLYNGSAGVTLFLAWLGTITGVARYSELARAALSNLLQESERQQPLIRRIGGFEGWGSQIYLLTQLGALWRDMALLDRANEITDRLPELIKDDEHFDLIGGAAGCILSLLGLQHTTSSQKALDVARLCGDRIVDQAVAMPEGIGWINSTSRHLGLAGLSHGASGIALALLELAASTGDERYRATAMAGLAYERTLYDVTQRNWKDLRDATLSQRQDDGISQSLPTAWCHGAPGIGLARLQMLPHLGEPEVRAEIEVAIDTTQANGFGDNHSLCHGDLGNLEFLSQAADALNLPHLRNEVEQRQGGIAACVAQGDWVCGINAGIETPGLMTGLAGIGYGLLRFAEPNRVPSVLTLARTREQVASDNGRLRSTQSLRFGE